MQFRRTGAEKLSRGELGKFRFSFWKKKNNEYLWQLPSYNESLSLAVRNDPGVESNSKKNTEHFQR